MAEIKPFRPLRYTEKVSVSDVVSPPYDIVSAEERASLIASSPYNIIGVELPAGDDETKYTDSAKLLRRFVDEGVLAPDETAGLYVYSETFTVGAETKTVYGFIARVTLREFADKVILPHEETLTKAKQDRFDLMCATNANISPIYALYSDPTGGIDEILIKAMASPLLASFTDGDGITHGLAKISDADDIDTVVNTLRDRQLFIADGHHRYETALRYKKHLESLGKLEGTAADSQMILLVDIDNPGLVVFPTHRLVTPPKKLSLDELISGLGEYFDVSAAGDEPVKTLNACDKAGCYVMCAGNGLNFLLRLRDESVMKKLLPDKSVAYATLDVTILHTLVLERLLGIDKNDMALGKSLTYTRDDVEALRAPDEGRCALSFLLNATKVHQIKDVSLAGEKMPQKSTYFYPKPVTGLVINDLNSLT